MAPKKGRIKKLKNLFSPSNSKQSACSTPPSQPPEPPQHFSPLAEKIFHRDSSALSSTSRCQPRLRRVSSEGDNLYRHAQQVRANTIHIMANHSMPLLQELRENCMTIGHNDSNMDTKNPSQRLSLHPFSDSLLQGSTYFASSVQHATTTSDSSQFAKLSTTPISSPISQTSLRVDKFKENLSQTLVAGDGYTGSGRYRSNNSRLPSLYAPPSSLSLNQLRRLSSDMDPNDIQKPSDEWIRIATQKEVDKKIEKLIPKQQISNPSDDRERLERQQALQDDEQENLLPATPTDKNRVRFCIEISEMADQSLDFSIPETPKSSLESNSGKEQKRGSVKDGRWCAKDMIPTVSFTSPPYRTFRGVELMKNSGWVNRGNAVKVECDKGKRDEFTVKWLPHIQSPSSTLSFRPTPTPNGVLSISMSSGTELERDECLIASSGQSQDVVPILSSKPTAQDGEARIPNEANTRHSVEEYVPLPAYVQPGNRPAYPFTINVARHKYQQRAVLPCISIPISFISQESDGMMTFLSRNSSGQLSGLVDALQKTMVFERVHSKDEIERLKADATAAQKGQEKFIAEREEELKAKRRKTGKVLAALRSKKKTNMDRKSDMADSSSQSTSADEENHFSRIRVDSVQEPLSSELETKSEDHHSNEDNISAPAVRTGESAGEYIIVEKPLTTSEREAKRIIEKWGANVTSTVPTEAPKDKLPSLNAIIIGGEGPRLEFPEAIVTATHVHSSNNVNEGFKIRSETAQALLLKSTISLPDEHPILRNFNALSALPSLDGSPGLVNNKEIDMLQQHIISGRMIWLVDGNRDIDIRRTAVLQGARKRYFDAQERAPLEEFCKGHRSFDFEVADGLKNGLGDKLMRSRKAEAEATDRNRNGQSLPDDVNMIDYFIMDFSLRDSIHKAMDRRDAQIEKSTAFMNREAMRQEWSKQQKLWHSLRHFRQERADNKYREEMNETSTNLDVPTLPSHLTKRKVVPLAPAPKPSRQSTSYILEQEAEFISTEPPSVLSLPSEEKGKSIVSKSDARPNYEISDYFFRLVNGIKSEYIVKLLPLDSICPKFPREVTGEDGGRYWEFILQYPDTQDKFVRIDVNSRQRSYKSYNHVTNCYGGIKNHFIVATNLQNQKDVFRRVQRPGDGEDVEEYPLFLEARSVYRSDKEDYHPDIHHPNASAPRVDSKMYQQYQDYCRGPAMRGSKFLMPLQRADLQRIVGRREGPNGNEQFKVEFKGHIHKSKHKVEKWYYLRHLCQATDLYNDYLEERQQPAAWKNKIRVLDVRSMSKSRSLESECNGEVKVHGVTTEGRQRIEDITITQAKLGSHTDFLRRHLEAFFDYKLPNPNAEPAGLWKLWGRFLQDAFNATGVIVVMKSKRREAERHHDELRPKIFDEVLETIEIYGVDRLVPLVEGYQKLEFIDKNMHAFHMERHPSPIGWGHLIRRAFHHKIPGFIRNHDDANHEFQDVKNFITTRFRKHQFMELVNCVKEYLDEQKEATRALEWRRRLARRMRMIVDAEEVEKNEVTTEDGGDVEAGLSERR